MDNCHGDAWSDFGLEQRQLMLEATMTAYQDCFLLLMALCVVVRPWVCFIRRVPGRAL
jgi:hypothetical protein